MTSNARYEEAEKLYGHPLQYAYVEGSVIYPGRAVMATETLDREAVLDKLLHDDKNLNSQQVYVLEHHYGELRVERYNRCPTCEQWSPCDVRQRLAQS
jgi:hypothetical protein